jgi:hypothetical protein
MVQLAALLPTYKVPLSNFFNLIFQEFILMFKNITPFSLKKI